VSASPSLTLGSLFHGMRNGLGDRGPVRVTIAFQQRTSTTPVIEGRRARSSVADERVLGADLDYDDRVMQRAVLSLGVVAPRPPATISVQRYGHGYVYSLDGEAWGRFAARPQIFDLAAFEEELGQVPVRDATIDQAVGARTLDEALDVDIDAAAFQRLLRIFSADNDRDADDLALAAFSVTIAGGDDVSMLYWWSLTGYQQVEEPDGGRRPYASKITCSATIRLAPLAAVERRKVKLEKALPEVAHVDDVWQLMRSATTNEAASATR
jgi:hypothetical protein